MNQKIVLFGGTFDPVHHGHLIVARDMAEARDLDQITLMPTGRPPHKAASGVSGQQRLAMCRLVSDRDPLFAVSDLEVRRTGRSYTIDTVEALREQGTEVTLVIGADMLADLPRWHRAAELVRTTEFLVAVRPPWDQQMEAILNEVEQAFGQEVADRLGESVVQTSRIDISSSEIRRRLCSGLSVQYLTPVEVCAYIERHGLYRTT